MKLPFNDRFKKEVSKMDDLAGAVVTFMPPAQAIERTVVLEDSGQSSKADT